MGYSVYYVLVLTIFVEAVLSDIEFKYHSNAELGGVLHEFVNSTENSVLRTSISSIGTTIDGNDLWVVEITAVEEGTLKIPNVKLIGNIHGNEAIGREILLHFLFYLRDQYEEGNPNISLLLNTTRIHILPTMNPDGFDRSTIDCEGDKGRYNGKGHMDLNRNFPDFYHKNPVKRQRETEAIINWMESVPFVLSAALHGGAMVANYPFDTIRQRSSDYHLIGYQSSPTPDDDVFIHLSKTYAKNHKEMHLGICCNSSEICFPEGITNGASWYPFAGGMQDYNYFQHGCMELTLEISCCKYPPAEELEKHWLENKQALLAFCNEAHRGIYGQVLDKITQEPIGDAQMDILGRNISFYSFKDTGEFWRILLPGNYTVKVRAEGYYDTTVPFEISAELKKVEVDIFLTDVSTSTTISASASTSSVTEETAPNPTASPISVNYSADDSVVLCEGPASTRNTRNVDCNNNNPEMVEILRSSGMNLFFSISLWPVIFFLKLI